MIDQIKTVEVAPAIENYVIALSQFTRSAPEVRLGVSPRGSLALLKAARATAAAARTELRHARGCQSRGHLGAGAPDPVAPGGRARGPHQQRAGGPRPPGCARYPVPSPARRGRGLVRAPPMTRIGVGAAVLGAVLVALGWLLVWPPLVVLGAGILILVLVALGYVVRRPRLVIEREIQPPRVSKGDPAIAYLSFSNQGRNPVPAIVASQPYGSSSVAHRPAEAARAANRGSACTACRPRGAGSSTSARWRSPAPILSSSSG